MKARRKAWVGSARAGHLLRTGRVTGAPVREGRTGLVRGRVPNLTGEPPVPGCGLTVQIDGGGLGKN